jgi:predicted MFS family arabinose efflux permease
LLLTLTLVVAAFALLPVVGRTWAGGLVLMTVWGASFGAIGIYNQAAILRAGGEHRDAANGLTVVTIQLGIAIGAVYGALALTAVGAQLVPLAAAVPIAAALAIAVVSRRSGFPAGPLEKRVAPA